MSKDTIYRQDAIEAVCSEIMGITDYPLTMAYEIAEKAIEDMPSVQPEIIRCKDCKHYYFADNRIPQEQRYSCALDGDRWKPEYFCSYAERKIDDKTNKGASC